MKPTGKRLGRFADWLSLLVIFVYTSSAFAQAPGIFFPTGNTTTPRSGHTATLLLNGKVLITGGGYQRPTSAELFDPVTGTFTATGEMTTAGPTSATLLADGRVLITAVGGTAELYDPASGTFTATGHMVANLNGHTATLLNNGKVLMAGGGRECPSRVESCFVVDRPELYDPVTGTFTPTGDYADKTPDPGLETAGLFGAPATLLPNGKVLMAAEPMAELYDPANGTFSITAQMTRGAYVGGVPRWALGGTSTLLTSGKLLLAGGQAPELGYYDAAELYDPSTSQFTAISSMTNGRYGHTATLLRDGTILIAGGYPDRPPYATAELYDPASGIFTFAANMTSLRVFHTATLLMDGRVLIVGGSVDSPSSAELYIPSVLIPAQVVTGLRVDQTSVVAGTTYSITVSGSNLSPQAFFDVRFVSPDSNESAVVLNWQRGLVAKHDLPPGIASGNWTINGVRAHEIETDHTGSFFPVNARITVSVN
jgi:hypothetical protein